MGHPPDGLRVSKPNGRVGEPAGEAKGLTMVWPGEPAGEAKGLTMVWPADFCGCEQGLAKVWPGDVSICQDRQSRCRRVQHAPTRTEKRHGKTLAMHSIPMPNGLKADWICLGLGIG